MSDIRIEIEAIDFLMQWNKLSVKMTQDTAMLALDPLLDPILQDARDGCPEDTGALKRSLAKRLKKYPGRGFVFAAIGPRRGAKYGGRKNPSRYAHIVELYGQPFLRPALDRHSLNFAGRFMVNFEKLL